MYQLYSIIFDVISAEIVMIPVLLLLHIFCLKNIRKTALYFVFATYLAGMFSVVGMPDIKNLTVDFGVNFIPLLDMVSDLKNAVLNVVLFIPLGFLLPLFSEKFRSLRAALLTGFGMTAAIEILQIFTYRLTDVNDLITNTLGTLLGYFVMKKILERKNFQPIGEARDMFILCAAVLAESFAVSPFVSGGFWDMAL